MACYDPLTCETLTFHGVKFYDYIDYTKKFGSMQYP